jgi:signal transduction histidine kinase/Tfp pilus assembly protein PilF
MKKPFALMAMVCPLLLMAQKRTPAIDSLEKLLISQKGEALAETYSNLAWEYRLVDREKAITYGNLALEKSQEIPSPSHIAQAYNDLGIIYFDKERYDTAIDLYNKALNIRQDLKDESGIAKLHNKIGIVYQKQGRLDEALDHQLKALELFEKHGDERGISYSLNNVGLVQQDLGRNAEAIKYHERSIALKEKMGDSYGLAGSFINLGGIYQQQKNYPESESYYKRAVSISREIEDKDYLSNSLNNLGKLYFLTNEFNKALPLIHESLRLCRELGDTKGIVNCLINLGDVYTAEKKYDSAKIILQEALRKGQAAVNCAPEVMQALLSLSVLYEKSGNSQAALDIYKRYSETKDSMFTEQLGQKVAEMETRFKTAEHEKTIQQQQFAIQRKNYWLAAAISVLLLGALAVYLFYRRYQHRQQIKLQEEIIRQQELSAKAVIIAAEEERQRIARDLHDGIGQMMSAAKMNLSAFELSLPPQSGEHQASLEKIISLVDQSCREIRQVSHNMMLSTSSKKNLEEALKDFINTIDPNVLNVHLYTEGLEEKLDPNTETMLYRIIQECVTNVIKHANATTLDITILKDGDGISATIEDNGKGFDITDKEKFSGIGLKNIHTRVEYLKGTVDTDSAPGRGTVITLQIPLGA